MVKKREEDRMGNLEPNEGRELVHRVAKAWVREALVPVRHLSLDLVELIHGWESGPARAPRRYWPRPRCRHDEVFDQDELEQLGESMDARKQQQKRGGVAQSLRDRGSRSDSGMSGWAASFLSFLK